jgi:acetyl esterase/lipase
MKNINLPENYKEIFLWTGTAPGSQNIKINEKIVERSLNPKMRDRAVSGISNPSITPMLPEKSNGIAILICPGGAYEREVIDKEGFDIAEWLNTIGVSAFILKYRLPDEGHENGIEVPLQDAQRAMRIIRKNAAIWNINPEKIGIMGFSAGGHVASSLGTKFKKNVYKETDEYDKISCKPDFLSLIYPVISMHVEVTHTVSKSKLLKNKLTDEIINNYSSDLNVTKDTPETFLLHAHNDNLSSENSIKFYLALKNAGVNAELHIFREGGHGFGIKHAKGAVTLWTKLFEEWLKHF